MAQSRVWTRGEEDYLRKNFYKMSRDQMAKMMNTSRSSITNKLFSLGLKNWNIVPDIYEKITPMELSYIAGLLDGEGSIFFAKRKRKNTTIYYEPSVKIITCSPLFKDWFKSKGFFVA